MGLKDITAELEDITEVAVGLEEHSRTVCVTGVTSARVCPLVMTLHPVPPIPHLALSLVQRPSSRSSSRCAICIRVIQACYLV